MTANIEAKIRSLAHIPQGEVDDTRFEKLFDDLAEKIDAEDDRALLFQNGLLSALKDGLDHEDERNRALSTKLLGRLVICFSDHSTQNYPEKFEIEKLVFAYLEKWASNTATLVPMEAESIAYFLKLWIPVLHLIPNWIGHISILIGVGLGSTSHFVRSASTEAFKELCIHGCDFSTSGQISESNHAQALVNREVLLLLKNLSLVPGNYTLFAVMQAMAHSPLYNMLHGHPMVEIIWKSLSCDTDSILAENARCCLRAMIDIRPQLLISSIPPIGSHGFDPLRERLENVIQSILQTDYKSSISNCLCLFEVKPMNSSSSEIAIQFRQWAHNGLLKVIAYISGVETMIDSQLDIVLLLTSRFKTFQQKMIALDNILNVLLRSSLSPSQTIELVSPLAESVLSLASISNSNSAVPNAHWSSINKVCKLLSQYLSIGYFQPPSALISLISMLLTSFKAPTPTKVAVIKLASQFVTSELLAARNKNQSQCNDSRQCEASCEQNGMEEILSNWKLFDTWFEPMNRHFRFSQDWELRDCMIQLLGGIASQCTDMEGIRARYIQILSPLLSGLLDANEHVRSSSWDLLARSFTHLRNFQHPASQFDVFSTVKEMQPRLLYDTFCKVDSQAIPRVNQSFFIANLLGFNDITSELESIADFASQFTNTIRTFLSDDEWDVRLSVIGILDAIVGMKSSLLRKRWSNWGCEFWLQTLLNDESREVKQQTWTFFQNHRAIIGELSHMDAPEPEELVRLISDLTVEAHYQPDDELYPLGSVVDENDLDCPY